jgi:acyl carrier protein
MQTLDELETEIKAVIIDALMLEDITVEEIRSEDALFVEGLGLDSIDALEIAMAIEERYGVSVDDDATENEKVFASVRTLAEFVIANRDQ